MNLSPDEKRRLGKVYSTLTPDWKSRTFIPASISASILSMNLKCAEIKEEIQLLSKSELQDLYSTVFELDESMNRTCAIMAISDLLQND